MISARAEARDTFDAHAEPELAGIRSLPLDPRDDAPDAVIVDTCAACGDPDVDVLASSGLCEVCHLDREFRRDAQIEGGAR